MGLVSFRGAVASIATIATVPRCKHFFVLARKDARMKRCVSLCCDVMCRITKPGQLFDI